ncbi:hypothetical protein D9758_003712 [Tetrapyrgos nigripes]|uniref:Uncharacterized protein n=1 Tax=Tetrapyrgos nigripes TaxID=182062 RepID=A0A8H5LSC0_9AGAR|nr:hypothetical protein D9758_003712 [Tetrapyrgos nigripes]
MSRRGTTPSLEASQRTHIDDLVQRNRTLEHTIKKLKEELNLEKSRSKNAINDIHAKWNKDKEEWRDGCDILQTLNRIEQLRLQVQLEKERSSVLHERDATRQERIQVLRRDAVLTTFKINEEELATKIEDLEQELVDANMQHEEDMRLLRIKNNELSARLQAQGAKLQTDEEEIDSRDAEISNLHKVLAEQQAAAQSNAAKLERATLQLDGERTKNAELQRTYDELRRTNQDLSRQLDKWQSLETKGGEEVEALRKQKVDLEIQFQALQNQSKKREEDHARQLEREKQKIEKLKANVDNWTAHSESLKKDIKTYEKTIAKLERELEKSRSELEAEHARVRSPQKRKQSPPPDPETSEDEVAYEIMQVAPSSPVASGSRNKSRTSRAASRTGRKPDDKEHSEAEEAPPKSTNKGKGKAKATDSDNEQTQRPRSKASRTARTKDKKLNEVEAELVHESGSEPEPVAKPKSRARHTPDDQPKRTGAKRKKPEASDDETGPPKAARKPASRTASVQSVTTIDADVDDASVSSLTKKPVSKKRKINIFAQQNSLPSLDFGNQNGLGLNIPTQLSPVREEDVPRATASSGFSRITSAFGRRG